MTIFTSNVLLFLPLPQDSFLPPASHTFTFMTLFIACHTYLWRYIVYKNDFMYLVKTTSEGKCVRCLPFCIGLISLNVRLSSYISKWQDFLRYDWVQLLFILYMRMCVYLLYHSSADGHLGHFHNLTIVNSAAMNMGV